MAKDYREEEMKPNPTIKEQFGIELFKRNHRCPFTKALEESQLLKEQKEKIQEIIFGVEAKSGGGIGTVTKITCNACEEEFNVTDYSVW
jgi:hypothetical protein